MTIKLSVCPSFLQDFTSITLEGKHEADVANVLISRLAAVDYEILIEDSDGDWAAFEDFEGFDFSEDGDGTEA